MIRVECNGLSVSMYKPRCKTSQINFQDASCYQVSCGESFRGTASCVQPMLLSANAGAEETGSEHPGVLLSCFVIQSVAGRRGSCWQKRA